MAPPRRVSTLEATSSRATTPRRLVLACVGVAGVLTLVWSGSRSGVAPDATTEASADGGGSRSGAAHSGSRLGQGDHASPSSDQQSFSFVVVEGGSAVDDFTRVAVFRGPRSRAREDAAASALRDASAPAAAEAVTYSEAIGLLSTSQPFRAGLIASLAQAPYEAFFWETPPVSAATSAATPFEFITRGSASLQRITAHADAAAFPLSDAPAGADAMTMPNLGGDAMLVIPTQRRGSSVPLSTYSHLAATIRGAPSDQLHTLWREVGSAMAAEVGRRGDEQPTWLSTSGLGVSWTHIRIDTRPKYYTQVAYRQWPYEPRASA